jgi:hypothetical protein
MVEDTWIIKCPPGKGHAMEMTIGISVPLMSIADGIPMTSMKFK